MVPLIATVFVASLLGSLHCAGMCGPLAVLASTNSSSRQSTTHVFRQTLLAYHGSRVIAYAIAGSIAGLIGAGIQSTGSWLGMQRAAAQVAGGSMMVIGLLSLIQLAGGSNHSPLLPQWLQRRLHQGHIWARKQPPVPRAAMIGLLTAILPCGWLAAFLIVAAGTARPISGALVMAFFALGSVPALTFISISATWVAGRFRTFVPWCSAVLVTVVGGVTALQRSHVDLSQMTAQVQSREVQPEGHPVTTNTLVAQVSKIDQEKLPCCCQKTDATEACPINNDSTDISKQAASGPTASHTKTQESTDKAEAAADRMQAEGGRDVTR